VWLLQAGELALSTSYQPIRMHHLDRPAPHRRRRGQPRPYTRPGQTGAGVCAASGVGSKAEYQHTGRGASQAPSRGQGRTQALFIRAMSPYMVGPPQVAMQGPPMGVNAMVGKGGGVVRPARDARIPGSDCGESGTEGGERG